MGATTIRTVVLCVVPPSSNIRRGFAKNIAVWPGNNQIKEKIEFGSIQR